MKTGRKADVTADELDVSHLPESGGDRVIAFIHEYLKIPRGKGARQPVTLRDWQQEIIRGLFDNPRPRQGLLSIPRGNGKSALAAMLGLYCLWADDVEGAEVLCLASDERQAGIVFNAARRMCELDERLLERCQIFANRIVVPHTNSVMLVLPGSDAGALQGYSPSAAIVDELHVVRDEVWEAMELAAGKRDRSLTLAISTPAGDDTGIMWRLVQHGRDGDDDDFYFREFAAPDGCEIGDEGAWHEANPALGDFLHLDALRATFKTARELAWRRYRLGQWVIGDENSWIPGDLWATCADPRDIEPGADVVLGFDGSFNGDATALVVVSCEEEPHVDVVELWEAPERHAEDWRVPILAVEDAIRQACRRWSVKEIVCDPFRWQRSMQVLQGEGLPMVEYPQTASRMTPATTRFYEAVCNGAMSHSDDRRLTRHVTNAVVRDDARGTRISKPHKHSPKRIDLAVAAVMAFDRAASLPAATYNVLESIW